VEDVVRHRPELDDDERAHRFHEDVERRVHRAASTGPQQSPEGRATQSATHRGDGVEEASREAVGDAGVAGGDGDDRDGGEDVQPGEAARGSVREVERVAHGAPHDHGADRARRVRGHDRGAALLAGADAQSCFQRALEGHGHACLEE
jgi:hypothetical protein